MNVFQYASVCETNWKKNLKEMTPYEPFTTFFSDLSIADFVDGVKGVMDTHKRVMKDWEGDYKYLAEYLLCVNHKSWEMHARLQQADKDIFTREELEELMKCYSTLYYKAKDEVLKMFEGNETAISYIFDVLD